VAISLLTAIISCCESIKAEQLECIVIDTLEIQI
jgi:hypothetical protein